VTQSLGDCQAEPLLLFTFIAWSVLNYNVTKEQVIPCCLAFGGAGNATRLRVWAKETEEGTGWEG
jgi:hypothetical protein